MKKFQFPLERVRRWRAEQAELEQAKLQQLYGQMAALDREKTRVESERTQSQSQLLAQASIDAGELMALDVYRAHVRSRIARIAARRQELAGGIEQQRQVVMEARRRAELLERLKKNKLEEWQTLADREEETLAGELFLAKWGRNGSAKAGPLKP